MANYKNRKNKLIALLMASLMATTALALTACDNEDTSDSSGSSSSTTEPAVDTSRIKNGSFEYFTSSDTTLIATSVNNWSNAANVAPSGQASTSQTASGIVNTDEDAWTDLTTPSGHAFATEAEAKANWDKLSANDKLKFVEDWKANDDNDDRKLTDLDFYDSAKDDYNIEYEDVPSCKNPGTHYATADDKNSHVLMIHNTYDNRGTAQKYTASSDIVLAAGTAAELSMWVKTSDLTYADNKTGETQDVIGLRGAYISITQQIGSVSLDNVYVKNIDTEAINPDGDNNGWVKYTFYLNGCSYSESTFKVVLGLGLSGGSNRMEYVSGYAFFDDVTCTTMRSSQYDTKVADAITAGDLKAADVVDLDTDTNDKIFLTDTLAGDSSPLDGKEGFKNVTTYAIDLDKSATAFSGYSFDYATVASKVTEQVDAHGNVYVSAYDKNGNVPAGKIVFQPLGFQTANDVTKLFANRAAIVNEATSTDNPYLNSFLANSFKDGSVFADKETLFLLSADGAAYTTDVTDATNFVVPANTRIVVSFFVKTSNMKGKTGLDIKLYNVDNTSNSKSLTALDTTSVTEVSVDSNEGADKDANIYEDWQQCFFFIENDTTETQKFAFTLNLGPKTVIDKSESDFYPGWAALTSFQTRTITKEEYSYATESTYTASVTLNKDNDESADPSSFDAATSIGKDIEKTLADLDSYRGVYGGSAYVNASATDKRVNQYAYAGLLSKEHLQNYVDEAANDTEYWLNKLNASADKAYLEGLLEDAAQPAIILADGTNTYGFIGEKQSVSAGQYAAISVRVKASEDASAYVYLTDMNDDTHESSLAIGRKVSYWYDKKGNICVKDPTADGFNKKTDIAFKLQSNGLYTVNAQWSGASSVAEGYYANLANYEVEDGTGNLLVAAGGVKYDYTSKWKNDGNDGIAFYHKDGSYYADSKYQTKVLPLSDVTALPTRYNATASMNNLVAKVVGTAEEKWQTVTFFVKAGTTALNYRLEVWSGDREGTTPNTANSYVLIDSNAYSSFDETAYNNTLNYALDTLIEGYADEDDFKANYANVLYDAFSFYDSAKFLRYDETADENKVGNSYTSYDATADAYGEGVAYLIYEEGDTKAVFANFSVADKAVEPDQEEVEDDTTEEEEEEGDAANVWLFASSIVLAAALLLAVVSLIVRKVSKKFRRKSHAKKSSAAKTESGAKRRFSMRKDTPKENPDETNKDE